MRKPGRVFSLERGSQPGTDRPGIMPESKERDSAAARSQYIRAALHMAAAASFLSMMIVSIRFVADDLDAPVVVFFRSIFSIVLFMPLLMRGGFQYFATDKFRVYFVRGIIAVVSMILWYYALAVTPLAEAVSLSFTAPLFTTVAAIFYLHESVGPRRWTALAIGFLGVLIILQPGFAEITRAHVLLLLSSALVAVSLMMVKVLSRTESPEKIVGWLVFLMAPLSLIPALFVWNWPAPDQYFWLVVIAVGGTGGHVMLARALRLAETSAIMPFDFLRLPLVAIIAYLMFAEKIDLWTWIGGAVIFVSTAYIARRETIVAGRKAETSRPTSSAMEAGGPGA